MAKQAPARKTVEKKPKSVSVAKVFQKAKVHPTEQTAPPNAAYFQKAVKPFQNLETRDQAQAGARTIHCLLKSTPLISTHSISNSTAHINAQASSSLKSICHTLSLRAIDADKSHHAQLLAASAANQKLLQPLEAERLHFKSHDGLSSGTVVLGDRMARFCRTVASEEKALEGLHQEWMDVQREITSLAAEALGAEGLEQFLTGALPEGFVTKEQEQQAEEVEGLRRKFMAEVERMGADAAERVRLEEKEMKIRVNKQKKMLIELFTGEED